MTNDALHDTAHDLEQDGSALQAETERATRDTASEMRQRARQGAESVRHMTETAPASAYKAVAGGAALLSLLLFTRDHKIMALLIGVWPAILSLAMLRKNRRPSHEVAQSTPLGSADGALLAE